MTDGQSDAQDWIDSTPPTRPNEADTITPPEQRGPLCDCKDCQDYKSLCESVHRLIGTVNCLNQLNQMLEERVVRLEKRIGIEE